MEHRQRDHVGGVVNFRNCIEIVLWFAFAWLWFLYLLVTPRARVGHVGVAGALMGLVGMFELAIILAAGALWWLI